MIPAAITIGFLAYNILKGIWDFFKGTVQPGVKDIIEVSENFDKVKPNLEKLAQVLLEKRKKPTKGIVVVPLWHGHKKIVNYHIDNPTRRSMYDYIRWDEPLRKFGFLFGNELLTDQKESKVDLGIYAFLPFAELVKHHGGKKIEGERIIDICKEFVKDGGKRTENTKLLLKFVFENCCDENFPEMIIKDDDDFAKAYRKLAEELKIELKNANPLIRQRYLSRYMRASFLGMYMSEEYFEVMGMRIIELGEKLKELEKRAKKIWPKLNIEIIEKKIKDSKLITLVGLGVSIFDPKARKEVIEREIGGPSNISIIIVKKNEMEKMKKFIQPIKEELEDFDQQVRVEHKVGGPLYHRVPIILNILKGEDTTLRSICLAYNNAKKELQQIKRDKKREDYGNDFERCYKMIRRYFVTSADTLAFEEKYE